MIRFLGINKAFMALLLLCGSIHVTWAQKAAFGVSLSGLEWGTAKTPTTAELTYYAGKGLKVIRIPFLWERVQTTLGQPLSTSYLATIDNILTAANTAGVSIILDMHNYCRYPYNGTVINASGGPTIAQYAGAWRMIAAHFESQPALWAYDIMNEPNSLGTNNHWFPMAQAAIDSIRKVDTQHVILVEGENWAHASTWTQYNDITANKLSSLVDPNNNLIFQAHQYFDSDGSGTYKSTSFSANNVNVNTGVTLVTPFVNWLKTNNLKGMVGEYGVPNNNTADQANWNTLLDNMLAYLKTNCVMGCYWAGGPGWTYLTNNIVIEPANSTDAPQMTIVQNYTTLGASCVVTAVEEDVMTSHEEMVSISPNPFVDDALVRINLTIPASGLLSITNMAGDILQTSPITDVSQGIALGAGLRPGIYWVQILSEGKRYHSKMVKY